MENQTISAESKTEAPAEISLLGVSADSFAGTCLIGASKAFIWGLVTLFAVALIAKGGLHVCDQIGDTLGDKNLILILCGGLIATIFFGFFWGRVGAGCAALFLIFPIVFSLSLIILGSGLEAFTCERTRAFGLRWPTYIVTGCFHYIAHPVEFISVCYDYIIYLTAALFSLIVKK